jgi:hypothetical protein
VIGPLGCICECLKGSCIIDTVIFLVCVYVCGGVAAAGNEREREREVVVA